MKGDEEDDWWQESAPKANISWDDADSSPNKGLLGATVDSTARLSRQLQDFDPFGSADSPQTAPGPSGEPMVPLNQIISEATIDLLMRMDGPDPYEKPVECSEEKLLEEMLLGHDVSLQTCRSLQSKTNLLLGAVNSSDGEVILKVVLHIMETLSSKHSYKLLAGHPVAFKVYANYLSHTHQHSTLATLYESLGMTRKAAMLHYQLATSNTSMSAANMSQVVSKVCSSHFNNDKWSVYLKQHIKVLDMAASLNLSAKATGHDVLWAAALQHPVESLSETAKSLGFTDKIAQWVCVRALISAGRFSDIEKLFKTKTWLGGEKMKVLISVSKFIVELEKGNAPKSEIVKYLKLVEDPNERRTIETRIANM